ncbi:cystinosin-like [Elysia marginata]|uniref:Cystinosin-like n=1 Tax=Elysia marginata TaxID=1093978 RepID=A0AAV4FKG5_9GAST|nr:cystinosin-like [Elysia marginata]
MEMTVLFYRHQRGHQKVSEWTRVILVMIGIVVTSSLIMPAAAPGRCSWTWFKSVNALSYVKVVVTVLKYWPQVLLNYRRKSTEGWSVHNVLLDFFGGWISLIQMFIDATASGSGNWQSGFQNIVKYWLCVITLVFDSIFLMQHYALYARKPPEYQHLQGLQGVLEVEASEDENETRDIVREIYAAQTPRVSLQGSHLVSHYDSERQTVPSINQQRLTSRGFRYPPINHGGWNTTLGAGSVEARPFSVTNSGPSAKKSHPSGENKCIHGPGHPCHQARVTNVQDIADDVPINSPTVDGSGNRETERSPILYNQTRGTYGALYPTGAINTPSNISAAHHPDRPEADVFHGLNREEVEQLQRQYQDLGIHFYLPRN